METGLIFQDATAHETPMLAIFAVAPAGGAASAPATLFSSQRSSAALQSLLASGEFNAALGEVALLHAPEGLCLGDDLGVGRPHCKYATCRALNGAGAMAEWVKP